MAGQTIDAKAHCDLERLRAWFKGDDESLQLFIEVFVETYPDDVHALREASLSGDLAALRRTAHHLRGSLAYFGEIPPLAGIRRIEALAESGEMAEAARLVPKVCSQTEDLALGLMAYRVETILAPG